MTKKNTKKEPKFIVDYTNIERPEDVYVEYILAKVRAGMAIDSEEAKMLVKFGAVLLMEIIDAYIEQYQQKAIVIENDKLADDILDLIADTVKEEKKPWYKRLWNWVKKPFCKKK